MATVRSCSLGILGRWLAAVAIAGAAAAQARTPAVSAAGPISLLGTLGGADHAIDVPKQWNGTLLLFSHGYTGPDAVNLVPDLLSDPAFSWMFVHHYALAMSAYSQTGWAVKQALHDDMALLYLFVARVGRPHRTIAVGQSMGGLITAALVELFPDRFAGAVPICGVVAGAPNAQNSILDMTFAIQRLLAPRGRFDVTGATQPDASSASWNLTLDRAQKSAAGRARTALVAALGGIPVWDDPALPAPAPTDYLTQESNQYAALKDIGSSYFPLRAELAHRAGGNPEWNIGVDYAALLAQSPRVAEVRAMYARAGLSLRADLAILAQAPRIAATPAALAYLRRYYSPSGRITVPVLTVHTIADQLVPVEQESAYAAVVRAAGHADLLRQAFVDRTGHCNITSAETVAVLQALVHRLDTGRWDDAATPAALQRQAKAIVPTLIAAGLEDPPAIIPYTPAPFPRRIVPGA